MWWFLPGFSTYVLYFLWQAVTGPFENVKMWHSMKTWMSI